MTTNEEKKNKKKKLFIIIASILLPILILAGVLGYFYYQDHKPIEIPLSEAIELSKMEVFSEVKLDSVGSLKFIVADQIERKVQDMDKKDRSVKGKTEISSNAGALTIKDLQDMGLMVSTYKQEKGIDIQWVFGQLFGIIMISIIFYLLFFSDIISGKAYKEFQGEKGLVSFSDIGGLGEVKDNLEEAISFMKDRNYLNNMGAQIPRGILLTGAPGTGKTMLARAVANEAGVRFLYLSASQIHVSFVAMAAQRIKKLFKEARKSPSIIFIDEFDSIAQKKVYGGDSVSTEFGHTLNQLLSEMDGFDKNTQVLVIAATNHPDALDPAVLRAGRFDRKIVVNLPTCKERSEILSLHAKGKPFSPSVSMDSVAKQTGGLSGADLSAILNESAIIAGRLHKNSIEMEDINNAIDKVLSGSERKGLTFSEEEKRLVAFHEAGHALIAMKLSQCDKVQRITILPHGQAGGFTRTSSEKEDILMSKTKAMAQISMLLGGRIAEELVIGDISTGAQNDLEHANLMSSEMVRHYGMGREYGLRFCQDRANYAGHTSTVSEDTQKVIDKDIVEILDLCYNNAKNIIESNKEILNKIAERLIESETLDAEEVSRIVG